jgi:serine/threonine-protein kinase
VRSQPSPESRWIGRVLRDKWRIDAKIARGGMGTVFAATHKNNGSTAAIKILHKEFSRDADTRSRFLQEGYAANKVSHPGVVRILDDDVTEEGLAYLVMELLQGELLEQRRIRKGGKLPLTEVYEFADQLLDVLAAAHAQGIVHRDIKPDNIFLTSQGRLKVLDFGFAQMKTAYRPEQTATGFLLGTPGFMAPEQAIGNRPMIDPRTDIWAVGATLFLLLTGSPVHAGESAAEQLVAAANFPVRSITTLEPGLPTRLAAAIDRALAFDRDGRWPDARSMQEALRAIPGKTRPAEPIRSSIVDPHERGERGAAYRTAPVPPDDITMRDLVQDVGADDLQLSGESRAYAGHPADQDGVTVAVAAPPVFEAEAREREREREDDARRSEALRGLDFSRFEQIVSPEETLVMNGRPKRPESAPPPLPPHLSAVPAMARPAAGMPPSGAFRPPYRSVPPPNAPIPIATPAENVALQRPELPYLPDAIPTEPPRRKSSRVLVFLVLAGITMVVVVLAGLIVLMTME